ncbi:MAG TPA: hypothetical protein VMI54_01495 [Polyangiaceae bacterium]|nr:hypothetical protein [Polyangiaceae bacterium]
MNASRIRLYGLSCELPPDFVDMTTYAFESETALQRVTFAKEPIPAKDADLYLASKAQALAESFDDARVGPVHAYSSPEFRAAGFETTLGGGEMALVLLSTASESLVLMAKGAPGYLPEFEYLVASIERRVDVERAIPKGRYGVYDYTFSSLVELRNPTQFYFVSATQKSRLTCEWRSSRPAFSGPDWTGPFVAAPEATITETARDSRNVSGRLSPRPDLARNVPVFEQASASAVAVGGARTDELFWAEARLEQDPQSPRHMYLRFTSQDADARAAWHGVLTSMSFEA